MPRKSKYSTDEILAILREASAGATVRAVCKRNGFTEKTFYRWRARFGAGLTAVPMDRVETSLQGNGQGNGASSGLAPTAQPRFGVREEELRRLQEENRRLKELVADLSLENRDLRSASARPAMVRLLAAPHDRR
jgi:putative transposase